MSEPFEIRLPGDAESYRLPDLPVILNELLQQIPPGRVTTYGDLAKALGDRTAARWVGEFLVDHPHDDDCSCHGVVRVNGEAGLYIAGSTAQKLHRLEQEGVPIREERVELDRSRFISFVCDQPLSRLLELQAKIAARVRCVPFAAPPQIVAGVDVSYRGLLATAAYVTVDLASRKELRQVTATRAVPFPYIPGYLTFRELPVLDDVIRAAEQDGAAADVILVDGNGILHPRRAGIATALGVILDRPVIGVSKSLLLGKVELDGMTAADERPIFIDGIPLGMALKSSNGSRPVFVSTGQCVPLEDAVHLVRALFDGHRLPEPVYWADRFSRDAAATG